MDEDPSPLRRIYFGRVELTPRVVVLRQQLDGVLLDLCRSLPPALTADACELLCSYGRSAAEAKLNRDRGELNFFHLFYSPLWSWIEWACGPAPDKEVIAGQAMAMFLHLFDDHLSDGQLRCDPLRLQLRTAAWLRLEESARRLGGAQSGSDSATAHRDVWSDDRARYFAAIYQPPLVKTLDEYCARFRDQMATCVAIPTLALTGLGSAAAALSLREILFGLGVAWRLLDDVQDAYVDMRAGGPTVFSMLDDEAGRLEWAQCRVSGPEAGEKWERIVKRLYLGGTLGQVLGRCKSELEQAAARATVQRWDGLAVELRQLVAPVVEVCRRFSV